LPNLERFTEETKEKLFIKVFLRSGAARILPTFHIAACILSSPGTCILSACGLEFVSSYFSHVFAAKLQPISAA
jgi:hypothetical protein